jgi:acetyl-CoA carboxylase carboxyl transferase subunit beta
MTVNIGNLLKFTFDKKTKLKKGKESDWVKCKGCEAIMYFKEVEAELYVCPKCDYHMKLTANKRIEYLADTGTFEEFDKNLEPLDPLNFVDKKSYKKRVADARQKTNRVSSVVSGECKINKIASQLVVFDFDFMGGSLGSVEGEKITRAIDRALKKQQPLIIVSVSGGARMQEGVYSLMQMAKTSAALRRLDRAKLPFISVITNPTMGGVSASFAMLGDILIAEPGALVGFAGQRVIKQTIGADLPDGFQTAEFNLEYGLIDMVVHRQELKKTIFDLLSIML